MIRSEENDSYRRDPDRSLSLLLIRRGNHPFKDMWALPGGFLEPGETIEQCALREIKEETNVLPSSIMPVGVFSDPGRDPRGWIISSAYVSVISESSVDQIGMDDASDARWFSVAFRPCGEFYKLTLSHDSTVLEAFLRKESERFGRSRYVVTDSGGLAFDHASVIASSVDALRSAAKSPETFCLRNSL